MATAAEAAIRETGAVPATVALNAGRLLVGLDDATSSSRSATAPRGSVEKVSRRNLAAAIAGGGWGATTVAATMIACHAAGIRVFATGGIGGVHRGALGGASPSFDISADLDELARTPVAVVCAGPKAILDVPLTIEYLETRGVPVVSIGIDEVPGFYARGSGIQAPSSVPDVAAAAAVIRAHEALGLASGLVICAPVPEDQALPDAVTREAVEQAIREADHTGIGGAALTPWLLARVAALTDGASVRANIALIVNNARVGGELAGELADRAAAAGEPSLARRPSGSPGTASNADPVEPDRRWRPNSPSRLQSAIEVSVIGSGGPAAGVAAAEAADRGRGGDAGEREQLAALGPVGVARGAGAGSRDRAWRRSGCGSGTTSRA